ncbi:unnamed protein product [Paramecium sonneborni]|uniref:Trichocyst matrix protein n=1 Tax=Paramecium sonneborni TaxID=65129 RepID=A0A8S1MXB3_9CILI|nr:unnamed protein product [Paramecium sonneborni]
MMKFIALALIASTVLAVQKDTKTVLAEIDADNFGNSILSTVQMYLQAKGNAEEILVLLNQLLAGLVDDQNKHDNVIRVDRAACTRIVTDLENSIAYHTAQISANAQMREDNEKALAEAENDVRQTIQDIESNERTFAQEEANRNKAHETWVRKNGEHDDAIAAVDEATKLVQHLSLGATFAELKPKFEAVQKRLIENESHGALFQPIVTALTELASKVDQKAIQRILQLLSQLRQQLVEARSVLEDTENRQAQRWVEFSTHLSNEHNRLVERKNQLEQSIQTFKTNIETATHFFEVHTLEQESAQETLDAENEWCASQENTYSTQSTERQRQQEIVERILEHLTDKLTATSQYLGGRF